MTGREDNQGASELTLPVAGAQAQRLAESVARSSEWSGRIARQTRSPIRAGLFRRFDPLGGRGALAAGFARVEPAVTGRPGYAPADLLKLYIYGYLNRVQSSRRLEREARRTSS